jgi:hypothetical protein
MAMAMVLSHMLRRPIIILSHPRLPLPVPLRCPTLPSPLLSTTHPASPRPFNHASQLLLLSPPLPRPQLPFLHPTSRHSLAGRVARAAPHTPPHHQHLLARFVSTETRRRWRANLRWHVRFHAYFWPMLALATVLWQGVNQVALERRYPTPAEWGFWTRWVGRGVRWKEEEMGRTGGVDWVLVGAAWREVVGRLEADEEVREQGDGGILVEGVGRTGRDVSMKSEPWRRGYWEGLMQCARVAENLDGHVRDKSQGERVFPKEVVQGPGNPRPVPMRGGLKEAVKVPREEDCEDAYESPAVWYSRVLTTRGFTTGQRVEAALKYADWLDWKGWRGAAQGVLEWGMDIATSGLPEGLQDAVVDGRTGVVKATATELVSENVLSVSTAMGVHYAAAGNVQKALPIFLGVLRARKDLPAEPVDAQRAEQKQPATDESVWKEAFRAIVDWVSDVPYPPPPPDGNQRPHHTLAEACEEVGLMTYVGEILYATSSREKGLSWTRDAVDASEAVMWVMQEQDRPEGKTKCQQCLRTGLANWKKMARNMAIRAEKQEQEALKNPTWFGPRQEQLAKEARRWEEEEMQIQLRIEKTAPLVEPPRPERSLGDRIYMALLS